MMIYIYVNADNTIQHISDRKQQIENTTEFSIDYNVESDVNGPNLSSLSYNEIIQMLGIK